GVCAALLAALVAADLDWPVLGVCLGHQLLGQAFGAKVVRAASPIHGKVWPIELLPAAAEDPLWAGLKAPLVATRYHSLVVDNETLPDCLSVTARTAEGDIMALRHRQRPLFGVQFHPESIGTPQGARLLSNFVRLCGERASGCRG